MTPILHSIYRFRQLTLSHEGNALREFYAALEGPVVAGIEATGSFRFAGQNRSAGRMPKRSVVLGLSKDLVTI